MAVDCFPLSRRCHTLTLFALLGWVACVCDIALPPPLVVVVVLFPSFPPRGSFLATSPPRRHINSTPLLLLSALSPNLGSLPAPPNLSHLIACAVSTRARYLTLPRRLSSCSAVILRSDEARAPSLCLSSPLHDSAPPPPIWKHPARPRRFGESRTPHFVSPRLPPRFDSGQHSTSTSIAPTTRGLCLPGHASPYPRHALPSALAFPPPPLHITPPFVSPPPRLGPTPPAGPSAQTGSAADALSGAH